MPGGSGSKNPFYQSRAWHALRGRALARDGYCCVLCGTCVRGKRKARIDHIHPIKTSPHLKLELTNVRTLCAACDNRRHREKYTEVRNVPQVNLDGTPAGWLDGALPPYREQSPLYRPRKPAR